MALKRIPEENPLAAPLDEEFLDAARRYRAIFEDDEELRLALEQWPRCPQCGRRRIARCPICKTSDSLFPLADEDYYVRGGSPWDAEVENGAAAVLCPVCSEAFVPTFLRRCEWCGHDFGDGEEDEADDAISGEIDAFLKRKAEEEESEAYRADPRRVFWTLVALGAGSAALLGYWIFVF